MAGRIARQCNIKVVRYLVTARVKSGRRPALDRAIDEGTLGAGSIAGDEYLSNMAQARALPDGQVRVETCFCATPLAEERPYWEDYFDLLSEGRTREAGAAMRMAPILGVFELRFASRSSKPGFRCREKRSVRSTGKRQGQTLRQRNQGKGVGEGQRCR